MEIDEWCLHYLLVWLIILETNCYALSEEDQVTCGVPHEIQHGRIEHVTFDGSTSIPGDIAYYRCSSAYTFNTSIMSTECRSDGTWSQSPKCVSIKSFVRCRDDFPSVSNGYVYFRSYGRKNNHNISVSFGDFVKYQCTAPYEMSHDDDNAIDYSLCGEDGRWTRPPNCTLKNDTTIIFIPVAKYVDSVGPPVAVVAFGNQNDEDCSDWFLWAVLMTVAAGILLALLIVFVVLFCRQIRRISMNVNYDEENRQRTIVTKRQVEPEPTPKPPPPSPSVVVIAPPPPAPVKVKTRNFGVNTDPIVVEQAPQPAEPPKKREISVFETPPPEKKIEVKLLEMPPTPPTPLRPTVETVETVITVDVLLISRATMTDYGEKWVSCQTDDVMIVDDNWLALFKAKIIADCLEEWERQRRIETVVEEDQEVVDESNNQQEHQAAVQADMNSNKVRRKKKERKLYYSRRSPIVSVLYHRPDPANPRSLRGVPVQSKGDEANNEQAVYGYHQHQRPGSSTLTRQKLTIAGIRTSGDMVHRKRWVVDQDAIEDANQQETIRRFHRRSQIMQKDSGGDAKSSHRNATRRRNSSEMDWFDAWKGTYGN